MNQNQHIEVVISKQSEQVRDLYRRRLTASIDCIRFLLKQGLAFRGHDESTNSANQGNFLELLRFLAKHNESINHVVLENAPENHQLIAPKIQKDIVNAAALETTNAIITDLEDELFAIIVDEARDISNKEQMAIALRYVNKKESIVERFFGMALQRKDQDIINAMNLVNITKLRLQTMRDNGWESLLQELAMILLVATSIVEKAFSAMKIVKNRLRNRLGDAWMNDCLVTYIEKDVFNKIDNEQIIQRFQNMKSHR
ncbi:Zinc finger MYM-type protein 1 [Glycine max]|nr:Zinc finger MYM-type protein 1 [Glycine max]